MLSKEDILEKNCDGLIMKGSFKGFYNAMDEYAEQVAIEFHKFVTHEKNWVGKIKYNSFPTRKELFELFKQENNIQ